MARVHFLALLGGALLAIFLTLQLIAGVDYAEATFPSLGSWTLLQPSTTFQWPIRSPDANEHEDNNNNNNNLKAADEDGTVYLVGVGKADITGPVVEINLMGYANASQLGTGLRQRLYSRAFLVASVDDPAERFVYLVLDTQSGDTAVRYGILDGLAALGPEYAIYNQHNVAVTGTHSHSGPGAWLNYLLPQITSRGFNKQSYQAIVDGAILSIRRAHEGAVLGRLAFGATDVEDANISRSPYAYLANPAAERARYGADVDKTMTMLRFRRAGDGLDLGVLTWFPVHGTSMLGNNTLISGDNKGVAADLFEKSMRGNADASPAFVAGFSQANVGDTSPNVLGAWCEDGSGEQCNFEDSTCSGRNEPCHGRGPAFLVPDQGASSCFEIGRRQFAAAKALFDSLAPAASSPSTSSTPATAITGSTIKSLHSFTSFSNFTFTLPNASVATTCPAALGYAFAAGTTDGPGAFDFTQNNTGDSPSNANPLWILARDFLHDPSPAQRACQSPKPILLDVGEVTRPYLWTPNVVDIQVLRVGQLLIVVSPGEATTMSGRRWKEALANEAAAIGLMKDDDKTSQADGGVVDAIVVLGGPANSYTHYIATEEEYGVQRYEGASTLYGPHTLNAYINLTASYLPYLSARATTAPPRGPLPPNNVNASLNFIEGVVFDRAPLFKAFGDVLQDVPSSVPLGQTVRAHFVGANPRNGLRLEGTYVAVERFEGAAWVVVRDDSDWDLWFEWIRTSTVLGTSEVHVSWESGSAKTGGVDVGRGDKLRVRYYGTAKGVGGGFSEFEGMSAEFVVV